jgi:dienelactone hydrolase
MKKLLLACLTLCLGSFILYGQKKVEFPSKDGILISADLYFLSDTLPYMILCHQDGSSRGEYSESARKFTKFMYNALAIDMRSGAESNEVKNETYERAHEKNKPTTYADAEQDILAAIEYAYNKSKKKVVLVGSAYSGSLVMKIAAKDPHVKAVIAFSPGEYFGKGHSFKENIKTIPVPVFVTSSKEEATVLAKFMSETTSPAKQLFTPASKGDHGSKALWKENQNSHEYWLAILMFMRQVH